MQKSEEINFWFMSPGTPQQNAIVELVFDTIYYQIHTMMMHTGLHKNINTGIWPECMTTSTKLKISW